MAAFGFHATTGELQKPLCFGIEMPLYRIETLSARSPKKKQPPRAW
jgi:hypothetical protein